MEKLDSNKPKKVTTAMTSLSENEAILTGKERYKVIGNQSDIVTEKSIIRTISLMAGLYRHWSCLEKAQIVQKIFGGIVVVGSMYVFNKEGNGSYGFEFNPPEFHSWVEIQGTNIVLDFALPGVIEKGLDTVDSIGPILKDIEPVILIGEPLDWMIYNRRMVISMI